MKSKLCKNKKKTTKQVVAFTLLAAFISVSFSLDVNAELIKKYTHSLPVINSLNLTEVNVSSYLKLKQFSTKSIMLEVSGFQPELLYPENEQLQKEVNDKIAEVYSAKVTQAKKQGFKTLEFTAEEKQFENFYTVLIQAKGTGSGSESTEVVTITLDTANSELVNLADVLGVNGLQICDKLISDEIKKYPDTFNPNFDGVTQEQSFYVEDNTIVVLFNENEIAAAAEGVYKIRVNIDSIKSVTIAKENIVVLEDFYKLKMIPLKEVCTSLGYNVSWNAISKAVEVSNGDVTVSLSVGKNNYIKGKTGGRALEAAPIIQGDLTYVPLSFFDQMLDVTYSIDREVGDIVFSKYEQQAQVALPVGGLNSNAYGGYSIYNR